MIRLVATIIKYPQKTKYKRNPKKITPNFKKIKKKKKKNYFLLYRFFFFFLLTKGKCLGEKPMFKERIYPRVFF